MAIQNRRGQSADFVASKMVPGEFAVSQDNRKLYLCFTAGNVKEIAIAEDMANAISEMNLAMEEWHDEVVEDTEDKVEDAEAWAQGTRGGTPVPSTDPAYQHNAKYYAENIVDNTLSIAGKAADAKKTGDEISDLKDDLGEISEVVDTETVDIYEYTPVPFSLVAGSWENRGVTFTQNDDGSVVASGTNQHTSGIIFGLRSSASAELTISLTAGKKYRLSGCPAGGGEYGLTLRYASGGGALFRDIGQGVICDITESTNYKIHVTVALGLTINETFTPKLEEMTVIGQETVNILSAKDTVARTDKVDIQQSISDAGKVLVVGLDGLLTPTEVNDGLSDEAKRALLACFRHVCWIDNDEDYYTALAEALDVEPERRITANFTPGDHIVYTDDALSTLIPYLTVTYYDDVTSDGEVISSNDYTLSGSLQAGNNTITVTYDRLVCQFSVTAIDFYNIYTWEYKSDGSGNLTKLPKDMFDMNIGGSLKGIFTGSASSFSKARTFITDRGKKPARINASPYDYYTPYIYPIPVPASATRAVCTITPNTYKISAFLFKYLNDSSLTQYDYSQITSIIQAVGSATLNFTAQSDLFIGVYINNENGTTITTEPTYFKVVFS